MLEGARNFRDLGGHVTRDGRRVRAGKIFRSDNLSALSDRDWATLRALDVRLIVDFRSREEIAATPPRHPDSMRRIEMPINVGNLNIEEMRKSILAGELPALEMRGAYIDLALARTDTYRGWMSTLLQTDQGASVFHCSSGKDRTGFAAVLLLGALGVPRETVLADYEASNAYLREGIEQAIQRIRQHPKMRDREDKLRELMGVRMEWMERTLDLIDDRYGSLDNYLEQAIGIDAAKREALRAIFLE